MSTATVEARHRQEATAPAEGQMTHRQILESMTGLLAGLFTALLSSTIVATALPTIIGDLQGSQRQYTWVITAALLATTVSTSIWGKLSDLYNKKFLVQLSLVIFVAGSIAAGLSESVPFLIGCRVVQGLGMGGLTALTQSIMASIIPPRERGRYSGYMGAVMAISTVSGPLLGGVIVDSPLGWRWCFYVCVPLAVIALGILQVTLKLPHLPRKPRIDYLGAVLIAVTASLPLLWVTFAGKDAAAGSISYFSGFDWISTESAVYLGAFLVALVSTILVELRAPEPMIPLRVMKNRTTALVIIASAAVGVAMFGGTTFLTQYFQTSRGMSPTHAGLMTIPLMAALLVSSTVSGQLVSKTGRWKGYILGGSVFLIGGLALLGTIDHDIPLWQVGAGMALMGFGMGAMMQNLVLAVQNTVDVKDVGATSATVAFFRTLGGAVGVSVLGAILANHVADNIASGLKALGGDAAAASGGGSTSTLDLSALPAPVLQVVRTAYGDATGIIFVIGAVIAVVAFLAVLFIKEVPLRTTVAMQPEGAAVAASVGAGAPDTQTALSDEAGAYVDPAAAAYDDADQSAIESGRPVREVEPVASESERAERTALAALDVLTSAQTVSESQAEANAAAVRATRDLLVGLGRDVDAALGQFHRGLSVISEGLDQSGSGRHASGQQSDSLRAYEFTLLNSTQQAADEVLSSARRQGERIVAEARTEAGEVREQAEGRIASLTREVEALREAEEDLRVRLGAQLGGADGEPADPRP